MRVLCVAEKPTISRSVTQILSDGQFQTHNSPSRFIKNYEFAYPQANATFIMTAVVGHLMSHDFPEAYRKWVSCDPFDLFDATVEAFVPPDKKDVERNLITQARTADELMIWTDCDREGEHIGMEIARVCKRAKPNIRVKRARFSAIIAQQIHRAAQNPVNLDQRQADAVEARILLDLRIGAAFTRLQTLLLQQRIPQISEGKNMVSYGPCQFPTLGFVVQRYNLVKDFQPETFWYINLVLTRRPPSGGPPEETKFNWKRHHLFYERAVREIFTMMHAVNPVIARVSKVTKRTTKKWKPLPLTTVELQKAASRLLKLAPKKTLDIAEKLYQQGFVSYPRTETDIFDPQFDHQSLIAKQRADAVWGQFAAGLQNGGYMNPRRGKNDDKAHPPIHPIAHANGLTGDEKRVYEFITRRYLACCSKDAEGWQTTIDIVCGGEEFSATGVLVKERNYLDVYIYDKWTDNNLPDFQEGEEFRPSVCEIRDGQTSKPNYLTEADLVTLMDKNGIGTDATIAQHIATIVEREYVIERMEGATKYLVPSTLGIGLVEGYSQIELAKNVSKPSLRRETERRMVQVCQGTTGKFEMLETSLDQYKEMFIFVKRDFARVTETVQRYLSGPNGRPAGNGGGGNGPRGGGPGGGGGRGGGGPPDNNGGGGGGNGRGRGRGRGTTGARGAAARPPTSGRGGVKKEDPDRSAITIDDSDFEQPAAKPISKRVNSSTKPASMTTASSSTWVAEPIVVSSTWQARLTPATISSTTSSAATSYTNTKTAVASTSYASTSYNATKPASAPPDCECGVPAIRKTNEAGYSAGSQYWGCQITEYGCDFYECIAESTGVPPGQQSVPAKRTYSSAGNDDLPARQCDCGQDSVQRTVVKESANKGRKFWKCQKREDENPCKFFEWDDQPPGPKKAASGSFGGGGGGGGGLASASDVCYKCDQMGHWATNCPNQGNNKRSRSFGTASTNNAAADAECYKCHQTGHFATSCPNGGQSFNKSNSSYSGRGGRGRGGGGGGQTAGECFNCGKTGHWSTNCPKGSSSFRGSTPKRGRGRGRGRGGGATKKGGKKSAFGAADDW